MTELEQKLFQLLEEERARANHLEQLLFERLGLLEREQVVTVDGKKAIGRLPWSRQKELLERKFNARPETLRDDTSNNGDGGQDASGAFGEESKQEKEVPDELKEGE